MNRIFQQLIYKIEKNFPDIFSGSTELIISKVPYLMTVQIANKNNSMRNGLKKTTLGWYFSHRLASTKQLDTDVTKCTLYTSCLFRCHTWRFIVITSVAASTVPENCRPDCSSPSFFTWSWNILYGTKNSTRDTTATRRRLRRKIVKEKILLTRYVQVWYFKDNCRIHPKWNVF